MDLNEMQNALSGIKELEREAKRFAHVKENYVQYAEKLNDMSLSLLDMSKDIKNMAKEIDPATAIPSPRTRTNFTEHKRELIELMQNGSRVGFDLIEKTYPTLSKNQIYNLITSLKDVKGVETTKDGAKLFLFWRNQTE